MVLNNKFDTLNTSSSEASNTDSEASIPETTALPVTASFIVSRTAIVSLFMLLGIVGNVFVLRFYGRNKKLSGQVYILALAIIDLASCVALLPQMPLFELQSGRDWPIYEVILCTLACLSMVASFGVQVTMAMDQFIAVYWPFQHMRLRRNLNRAMFIITCFVGALMNTVLLVTKSSPRQFGVSFIILGMFCALVLVIVYPATAYKLYLQSTRIHPQPEKQASVNSTKSAPNNTSGEGNKTEMHVQAFKIYMAILIQLFASPVVSNTGLLIIGSSWPLYFYFINHIGNPVIYYCFVPRFRDGVKASARALCHRK